jgi:ribose transport system permease protein
VFVCLCVVVAKGRVHGPESIAIAHDGQLYIGSRDGRILKVASDDSDRVSLVASISGRPLGLHFHPRNHSLLYVAEAVKGMCFRQWH